MTLSSKNLNLMTPSLFSRNIVLIGGFDLAIFDRYFFIKNEIFNDKDIQYQSSFNPQQVIQIFNSKYNFFITPNQIIISSLSLNNLEDNINELVKKIIQIGSFGISAVGFNFHWSLRDNTKSIPELSKENFYSDNIKILSFFKSNDARFGTYASMNFLNSRLKLDVKPVSIQNTVTLEIEDVINFAFNFHFDAISNNNDILLYLNDYINYYNKSYEIISIYH